MRRTIFAATLVAGTLDILAAVVLTLIYGREPAAMLRTVASGPFPQATEWGIAGSLLGLAVHFALMTIMVTLFVIAARHRPAILDRPLLAGTIYGLVTYVAMNLIVVPLRFGGFPPKPINIATQTFCHIVLVGIPIALIAARSLRQTRR